MDLVRSNSSCMKAFATLQLLPAGGRPSGVIHDLSCAFVVPQRYACNDNSGNGTSEKDQPPNLWRQTAGGNACLL